MRVYGRKGDGKYLKVWTFFGHTSPPQQLKEFHRPFSLSLSVSPSPLPRNRRGREVVVPQAVDGLDQCRGSGGLSVPPWYRPHSVGPVDIHLPGKPSDPETGTTPGMSSVSRQVLLVEGPRPRNSARRLETETGHTRKGRD